MFSAASGTAAMFIVGLLEIVSEADAWAAIFSESEPRADRNSKAGILFRRSINIFINLR